MMSNVKTKPAKKLRKSTTDSLINYGIVIFLGKTKNYLIKYQEPKNY